MPYEAQYSWQILTYSSRRSTTLQGRFYLPDGRPEKVGLLGAGAAQLVFYALAASCPPSGRKYCVPLIGSVTLRSNSCRSSLRSTKSISDVFTISRSDDVQGKKKCS